MSVERSKLESGTAVADEIRIDTGGHQSLSDGMLILHNCVHEGCQILFAESASMSAPDEQKSIHRLTLSLDSGNVGRGTTVPAAVDVRVNPCGQQDSHHGYTHHLL